MSADKDKDIFNSIYGSVFDKAFILGLMKINPRERKVFFDIQFTKIAGLPDLIPNEWIDLESSGLIEFLSSDMEKFKTIQDVFRGISTEDILEFNLKTTEGTLVEGKIIVGDRYDDNVPKEFVGIFIDASYIENAVKKFNKINTIFESAQEISRASTWWINYDEGEEFFSQTDNGAIAVGLEPTNDQRYSIADYSLMRENAAKLNADFRVAVDEEIKSFSDAARGLSDNFGARTPLLTDKGEVVWTDSRGKVILRYEDGSPRFIVAVDIFVNDIIEKENEIFKLQSLIDQGLTNSNIGVWWYEIVEGGTIFHQTKSFREVMGMTYLSDEDKDGLVWAAYLKKFRRRFPSYNSYIDDDANKFAGAVNGEFDSYTAIHPVLSEADEIKWIEVRATVIKRDSSGKASLMVGVNVDISDRLKTQKLVEELERKNLVLNNANSTTIDASGLLVWSNDKMDVQNKKKYFANSMYIQTLGMPVDSEGLVSLEDYYKSAYPDTEGKEGFEILKSKFSLLGDNKISDFSGLVVKHRNLKTGEAVFLEHNAAIQELNKDGKVRTITGYIKDITENVVIERENIELNKLNERLSKADKLAIKSGKVLVWYQSNDEFDGTEYFFGNDIFSTKFGIKVQNNGLMLLSDYRRTVYKNTPESLKASNELKEAKDMLYAGEIDNYEKLVVIHKNLLTGKLLHIEHASEVDSRFEDGYIKAVGGYMVDVSEAIESKRQIVFLAERDTLTSLYNRNYFESYVKEHLDDSYSLIIFDLDGLKLINDTFGHLEGDKVIKFSASIIKKMFDVDSVIARIGGDEFAVISKLLNEKEIAKRYSDIANEITVSNKENSFDIALSGGHEIVINNNKTFEDAFGFAENLMYRRKLNSRKDRKSNSLDSILLNLSKKAGESEENYKVIAETSVNTLKELGYSRTSEIEDILLLARVHDIGKITIPVEILLKEGKFTKSEYEIIKKHSEAGYKIMHNILDSKTIAEGVLYHHERIDGHGYPSGIMGDEIPIYAKIICVADAYEAMVMGRSYSITRTKEEAFKELLICSGTQFDEKVVKAFIKSNK